MATKKIAIPQDEKLENQDFNLFEAIAALTRKTMVIMTGSHLSNNVSLCHLC